MRPDHVTCYRSYFSAKVRKIGTCFHRDHGLMAKQFYPRQLLATLEPWDKKVLSIWRATEEGLWLYLPGRTKWGGGTTQVWRVCSLLSSFWLPTPLCWIFWGGEVLILDKPGFRSQFLFFNCEQPACFIVLGFGFLICKNAILLAFCEVDVEMRVGEGTCTYIMTQVTCVGVCRV